MRKKTKQRIKLSLIVLGIVFFVLIVFPIAIPPSEREIKETIEGHLSISLPESFDVVKNEAVEAPIFQIQGIVRSEDVAIQLPAKEYEEIRGNLLARHAWKSHEGGSYSLEITNEREKIYFFLPSGSERITYLYTYD